LKIFAGGICAAADNKVHCFSLDLLAQQFILQATLEVKQQGIADICIRQDQRLFATAGWDGKIRVFHYKKQKALAILQVSCARACDIISLNQLCTFCEAASAAPSSTQTIHKEDVTQSLSRHLSIGCILWASCESSVCFGVDCCLLTLMDVG
jgi:WD40 repeat protein